MPNVLSVVIVYLTLTVPAVIILESFLSFLGLGVDGEGTGAFEQLPPGAHQMVDLPVAAAVVRTARRMGVEDDQVAAAEVRGQIDEAHLVVVDRLALLHRSLA